MGHSAVGLTGRRASTGRGGIGHGDGFSGFPLQPLNQAQVFVPPAPALFFDDVGSCPKVTRAPIQTSRSARLSISKTATKSVACPRTKPSDVHGRVSIKTMVVARNPARDVARKQVIRPPTRADGKVAPLPPLAAQTSGLRQPRRLLQHANAVRRQRITKVEADHSAAQWPYMMGMRPTNALKRSQLLRSGRVQPASAMAERRGKTRRSKMARSVMDSDQMQD